MINAFAFDTIFIAILLISGAFEYRVSKYFLRTLYYGILLLFVWGGSHFNGSDWMNYHRIFLGMGNYVDIFSAMQNGPFEWFFDAWMWIVEKLQFGYQSFIFSVAFVNTSCLLWFMRKAEVQRWGWVLAMIYLISGWTIYQEQLRQSLAISLLLVFYVQMLQRRWAAAAVAMALATGCHSTAIIGLLLYGVIWSVQRSEKPISIVILLKLSAGFVAMVAAYNIFGHFNLYENIGLGMIQYRYDFYEKSAAFGDSLLNAGLLGYPIGFIALWLARRKEGASPFWHSVSWSMGVLWCFIGPILRSKGILIRLEQYLLIFFPFAVMPYLSDKVNSFANLSAKKIAVSLYISVFAATFTGRVLIRPEYTPWVYDYQNFFISSAFGETGESRLSATYRQNIICNNLNKFNNYCQ